MRKYEESREIKEEKGDDGCPEGKQGNVWRKLEGNMKKGQKSGQKFDDMRRIVEKSGRYIEVYGGVRKEEEEVL